VSVPQGVTVMSLKKQMKSLLHSTRNKQQYPEIPDQDKELQKTRDTMQSLRSLKQDHSFGPYFADRVIRRIQSEQELSGEMVFFQTLRSYFTKLAFASAFAMLFLIVVNVMTTRDPDIHTILSVPQVTVQDLVEPTFFEEAQ
jgi:hypothetical protein